MSPETAGVHAAIAGHLCVTHGRQTELICWGKNHGLGRKARVRFPGTGAALTVDKTAVQPIPCDGGCEWCTP